MQTSTMLQKAYRAGNVQGPFSSGPFAIVNTPSGAMATDGFVMAGQGGIIAQKSLTFIPYSDAAPGQQFSVRVYYWNHCIGIGAQNNPNVWMAVPLIELLCTSSNVSGPRSGFDLDDTIRFCDQITLTAGNFGLTGTIYQGFPGGDTISMVTTEIAGARMLNFDFQAVDGSGNPISGVNMNALWGFSG